MPPLKGGSEGYLESTGGSEAVGLPTYRPPGEDFRKRLGDALAAERRAISLEMERRHQQILADCAQQWGSMPLNPSTPRDEAPKDLAVSALASGSGGSDSKKEQQGQAPQTPPAMEPEENGNNVAQESDAPSGSGTASSTTAISTNPSDSSKADARHTKGRKKSKRSNMFKEEGAPPERWLHHVVTSHAFEVTFAALIVANTIVMAAETQYIGIGVGNKLKHRHYPRPKEVVWPGADDAFIVLDWVFGIVFSTEVVIKIIGLRKEFFCDLWNLFDLVIVLTWLVDACLRDVVQWTPPIDPMLLRLARLARLVRLVKLLKTLQGVDQLFLLITALKGSFLVLVWTVLVLVTLQTMFAFILNQIIVTYFLDVDGQNEADQLATFKFFGTFSRSMLSMFEITVGNWVPVARNLYENVSPWFLLFSLFHKLTMGFAVLGVINGIFIQETFKVAHSDDTIMVLQKERAIRVHGKKMQTFFKQADASGDGNLDRDEFRQILTNPHIKTWLAAQELDASDADKLFTLLDNGDGLLSGMELVKGVSKLKGAARSIDVNLLLQEQEHMEEQLKKLSSCLADVGRSTELSDRLAVRIQKLSDRLAELGRGKGLLATTHAFDDVAEYPIFDPAKIPFRDPNQEQDFWQEIFVETTV